MTAYPSRPGVLRVSDGQESLGVHSVLAGLF